MKHYKVIKKDTKEEVWKGIADSKWEALERGYSKHYFINPKIKRANLVVKILKHNSLKKF
jgi:hypothetical protein